MYCFYVIYLVGVLSIVKQENDWNFEESLWTSEMTAMVNKAFLIRKFMDLKYWDNSYTANHLNENKNLIHQLASMKITLDE